MTELEIQNKINQIEKEIKKIKQLVINQGLRKLSEDHPYFQLNEELKNLKSELSAIEEVKKMTPSQASFGLFHSETKLTSKALDKEEPKHCPDRR